MLKRILFNAVILQNCARSIQGPRARAAWDRAVSLVTLRKESLESVDEAQRRSDVAMFRFTGSRLLPPVELDPRGFTHFGESVPFSSTAAVEKEKAELAAKGIIVAPEPEIPDDIDEPDDDEGDDE